MLTKDLIIQKIQKKRQQSTKHMQYFTETDTISVCKQYLVLKHRESKFGMK